MSGRFSRGKGSDAEREVAALLGVARNARNGIAAGDLAGPEGWPFSVEVKRRARAYGSLYWAIAQAESYGPIGFKAIKCTEHGFERAVTPIAIVRDNRASWLLIARLSDMLELLPGLRVKGEA